MKMSAYNFIQGKVVKNGLWLYLALFFNTAFPLITLPYVTRILGATGFGIFSTVLNVMLYCQTFIEYGFNLSATRRVSLACKDKNELKRIFTRVLCTKCCLTLVCCLCILLYFCFFKVTYTLLICYGVMSIYLYGSCLQQNWLFQGLEEF